MIETLSSEGFDCSEGLEAKTTTAVADQPGSILTHRELECLSWSAAGKTYGEMASIMRISPRTVRFFLENARKKCSARNTTHAVAVAITSGLISISSNQEQLRTAV